MDARKTAKVTRLAVEKIFESQWKFESQLVTGTTAYGKINTIAAGRAAGRTNVGSAVMGRMQVGERAIILGRNINDMPLSFGRAPWITG